MIVFLRFSIANVPFQPGRPRPVGSRSRTNPSLPKPNQGYARIAKLSLGQPKPASASPDPPARAQIRAGRRRQDETEPDKPRLEQTKQNTLLVQEVHVPTYNAPSKSQSRQAGCLSISTFLTNR